MTADGTALPRASLPRTWILVALAALLGGIGGYAASIAAIPPVACLVLPLLATLGLRAGPWTLAFAGVFAFHAIGTRDLFTAAHAFFPDEASAYLANLGLIAICAVLAVAWTWIPRLAGRWGVRTWGGVLIAFMLALAPPLGVFGVLHPVLAYGFVWSGGGWAAIAVLSAALCWFAAWMTHRRPEVQLAVIAGALILSPLAATEPLAVRGNDRFRTVNTAWTDTQLTVDQRIDRITKVGKVVRALEPLQVTWIIFPESTVREAPGAEYLLGLEVAKARRATVWLGASQGEGGELAIPLLRVFNPDGTRQSVYARQPMPISLWRPWAIGGARWLAPALVASPIGPAYLSMCYEDMVPGLFLLSAAREGRPSVVVSIANNSFLPSRDAVQAQAWRIESMARLFGLLLLRAVNLPRAGQAGTDLEREAGTPAPLP